MPRRITWVLVAALALGACELPSFGAPDPASEQGEEIYDLFRWFAAAAAGVGVFVTVLLLYTVIRFRRRDDEAIPSQTPYNIPVEVTYTVIPLLIVAVLFVFSVRTEDGVSAQHDDPDHVVEVVGYQWQWQFNYADTGGGVPGGGISVTGMPGGELPELVLAAERTTRLDLRTTDVIHSFWVPQFLNKKDMIPGLDNSIDVTPTETGTYDGVCAEYCGLDHGRMRFTVRVVEPDEFDAWLEEASSGEVGR